MTRTILAVLLLSSSAFAVEPEPMALKPRPPVVLTDEAQAIHREALVVDGHNDLPWQFAEKKDLSFRNIDIRKLQKGLHTDLPRLREGGVGAQFWAAFVLSSTRKEGTAVRQTLEQIDFIHRMVR